MDKRKRKLLDELDRLDDGPLLALTEKHFRQYLAEYPGCVASWVQLGSKLTELQRYREAEVAIKRGIKLCPRDKSWALEFLSTAQCTLGEVFKAKGNTKRAIQCFQKATEFQPQDATGRIYLGGLLARLGRVAEAEAIHRESIRCEEGCLGEAYLNLAYVLAAQERFEEARENFQEALKRNPDYPEATEGIQEMHACIAFWPSQENYERKSGYAQLQKLTEGRDPRIVILFARDFLSQYPDHCPAWMWLGIRMVEMARYREAEIAFKNALTHCPNEKRPLVYLNMGYCWEYAREFGKAERWFRLAIKVCEQDGSYWMALGELQAARGKLREAQGTFLRAMKCKIKNEALLAEKLGHVYRSLEQFKKAAHYYRLACKLDRKRTESRNGLQDVEACLKFMGGIK